MLRSLWIVPELTSTAALNKAELTLLRRLF